MRTATQRILDVQTIYHEPAVPDTARGAEVLARFPDSERIVVPSHQAIPELHGNAGAVEDWVRTKRSVLVLGEKLSLTARPTRLILMAPSSTNFLKVVLESPAISSACLYVTHSRVTCACIRSPLLLAGASACAQYQPGVKC